MKHDIHIYLVPMPTTIKECVAPELNGGHTIYINNALTKEQQMAAYSHAMKHIEADDFDIGDIQEIEQRAHA